MKAAIVVCALISWAMFLIFANYQMIQRPVNLSAVELVGSYKQLFASHNGEQGNLLAGFSTVQTLSRPIFSSSRRQWKPQEIAVNAQKITAKPEPRLNVTPIDKPQIRLLGIEITSKKRSALIKVPEDPIARWINKGGHVSGWKLTEVEDGKLVLVFEDERMEVTFYD